MHSRRCPATHATVETNQVPLGGAGNILPLVRELVFIVNVSSGGRRGASLLARLQQTFAPDRVHPFAVSHLDAIVARATDDGSAVIACGGDGTVAAVLASAHRCARADREAPVGIIPLGTGNDLARTLGWFTAGPLILASLRSAPVRRLDRWTFSGGDGSRAWFNYCSFGYDARVAQRFHAVRDHHPYLFRATMLN
nr:hypothetical protein [Planctomycetota bacterium]